VEALLLALIASSVAAIGSVHRWAYVPLWFGCLALALLEVARAVARSRLRRRLGARVATLHVSGRWLALDSASSGQEGWSVDLGLHPWRSAPLLWPALAFLAWVLLQLVPFPDGPTTISRLHTARGLAFLAACLAVHMASAGTFASSRARRRFRRFVALLGSAVALTGLVQLAAGAARIYGVFEPHEDSAAIFGPFVNRNHFAGYMLLVIPICLSQLARAQERYAAALGPGANLRRHLVKLGRPEGTALVEAAAPALLTIAALAATTSRGALLAFVGALGVTAVQAARRHTSSAALWAAAAFIAVSGGWVGFDQMQKRFGRVSLEATGRYEVWKDTLSRMEGRWITGHGFNTFAIAMSRAAPWTAPTGSTPWPDWFRPVGEEGVPVGTRVPARVSGLAWYREAHNEYLQVLAETGIPGLALALAAAAAVLWRARGDQWLLAALLALLLHCFVDFDLQIPALAVLASALAALGRGSPAAPATRPSRAAGATQSSSISAMREQF
jgi:O-antigen ligase